MQHSQLHPHCLLLCRMQLPHSETPALWNLPACLRSCLTECCMDLLHIEIIALYTRLQQKQQQQPAQARNELMARRMEAIGFQVGQQLVER